MTKITIQRDVSNRDWYVEEDGVIRFQVRDKNGSRTSGRRQAQRELAELLAKNMGRESEDAHRISYLAIKLVQESELAVTLSLSRQTDLTKIGN